MAVNHLYTVLCDYIMKDPTGRLSFLGVIAQITLPKFPSRAPTFYLALSITGAPGDRIRIDLVDEERTWRNHVFTGSLPATPNEATDDQLWAMQGTLNGTKFPHAGHYFVALYQVDPEGAEDLEGGALIHVFPFGVQLRPPHSKAETMLFEGGSGHGTR